MPPRWFDPGRFIRQIGLDLVHQFAKAKAGTTPATVGSATDTPARNQLQQLLPRGIGAGQGFVIDSHGGGTSSTTSSSSKGHLSRVPDQRRPQDVVLTLRGRNRRVRSQEPPGLRLDSAWTPPGLRLARGRLREDRRREGTRPSRRPPVHAESVHQRRHPGPAPLLVTWKDNARIVDGNDTLDATFDVRGFVLVTESRFAHGSL